jgi:polyisoprenoid-binding protein YceI
MTSAPQAGSSISTVRYAFDPTVSRFTVQAFATGLLSSFGHSPTMAIRDFEGGVAFPPDAYEKTFVHMKINLAALEVLDEMKRRDLEKLKEEMFDVVLQVDRFPSSVFESNRIEIRSQANPLLVLVAGDLTLRGVTHRHSFNARVSNPDSCMRISGDFSLRQSDYGIKPASFAGGTLRLKDELKFSFEIIAKREVQTGGS